MTFNLIPSSSTAREGVAFSFTLTPISALTEETTIYWEVVGRGTLPTFAGDFVMASGTASFASGATAESAPFTIDFANDDVSEFHKSFEIRVYAGTDNTGELLASSDVLPLADDDTGDINPSLPDITLGGNDFADVLTAGGLADTTLSGVRGDDIYIISRFQYGDVSINDNDADTNSNNIIKFDAGVVITNYREFSTTGDVNNIMSVALTLNTGAVISIDSPLSNKLYQLGDGVPQDYAAFKTAIGATGTNEDQPLPEGGFAVPFPSTDDGAADVRFTLDAAATATEGTAYEFSLTPNALTQAVNIYWEVVGTGAIPTFASQFDGATSGTFSFGAGAANGETLTINFADDNEREVRKTFEIRIYEGTDSSGTLLASQSVILIDDAADGTDANPNAHDITIGGNDNADILTAGGLADTTLEGLRGDDVYIISRFQYGDVFLRDTTGTVNVLKFDAGVVITGYEESGFSNEMMTRVNNVEITLNTGAVITVDVPAIDPWAFQLGDGALLDYAAFKAAIGTPPEGDFVVPFPTSAIVNEDPTISQSGQAVEGLTAGAVDAATATGFSFTITDSDNIPANANYNIAITATLGGVDVENPEDIFSATPTTTATGVRNYNLDIDSGATLATGRYEITITATQTGAGASTTPLTQTFALTVLNHPGTPPAITSSPITADIIAGANYADDSTPFIIGQVDATDADVGDAEISYALARTLEDITRTADGSLIFTNTFAGFAIDEMGVITYTGATAAAADFIAIAYSDDANAMTEYDTVAVSVTATPNAAPTATQQSDISVVLRGTAQEIIDLSTLFSDADSDTLYYDVTITANDGQADATYSIDANNMLTLTATALGGYTVSITARDREDDENAGSATQTFAFSVTEPGALPPSFATTATQSDTIYEGVQGTTGIGGDDVSTGYRFTITDMDSPDVPYAFTIDSTYIGDDGEGRSDDDRFMLMRDPSSTDTVQVFILIILRGNTLGSGTYTLSITADQTGTNAPDLDLGSVDVEISRYTAPTPIAAAETALENMLAALMLREDIPINREISLDLTTLFNLPADNKGAIIYSVNGLPLGLDLNIANPRNAILSGKALGNGAQFITISATHSLDDEISASVELNFNVIANTDPTGQATDTDQAEITARTTIDPVDTGLTFTFGDTDSQDTNREYTFTFESVEGGTATLIEGAYVLEHTVEGSTGNGVYRLLLAGGQSVAQGTRTINIIATQADTDFPVRIDGVNIEISASPTGEPVAGSAATRIDQNIILPGEPVGTQPEYTIELRNTAGEGIIFTMDPGDAPFRIDVNGGGSSDAGVAYLTAFKERGGRLGNWQMVLNLDVNVQFITFQQIIDDLDRAMTMSEQPDDPNAGPVQTLKAKLAEGTSGSSGFTNAEFRALASTGRSDNSREAEQGWYAAEASDPADFDTGLRFNFVEPGAGDYQFLFQTTANRGLDNNPYYLERVDGEDGMGNGEYSLFIREGTEFPNPGTQSFQIRARKTVDGTSTDTIIPVDLTIRYPFDIAGYNSITDGSTSRVTSGTGRDDVIQGGGGDDRHAAGGGEDVIIAGTGNDVVNLSDDNVRDTVIYRFDSSTPKWTASDNGLIITGFERNTDRLLFVDKSDNPLTLSELIANAINPNGVNNMQIRAHLTDAGGGQLQITNMFIVFPNANGMEGPQIEIEFETPIIMTDAESARLLADHHDDISGVLSSFETLTQFFRSAASTANGVNVISEDTLEEIFADAGIPYIM